MLTRPLRKGACSSAQQAAAERTSCGRWSTNVGSTLTRYVPATHAHRYIWRAAMGTVGAHSICSSSGRGLTLQTVTGGRRCTSPRSTATRSRAACWRAGAPTLRLWTRRGAPRCIWPPYTGTSGPAVCCSTTGRSSTPQTLQAILKRPLHSVTLYNTYTKPLTFHHFERAAEALSGLLPSMPITTS